MHMTFRYVCFDWKSVWLNDILLTQAKRVLANCQIIFKNICDCWNLVLSKRVFILCKYFHLATDAKYFGIYQRFFNYFYYTSLKRIFGFLTYSTFRNDILTVTGILYIYISSSLSKNTGFMFQYMFVLYYYYIRQKISKSR